MPQLLVVDDSAESFELTRRSLGTSVRLDWVKNIRDAISALGNGTHDLVLLDIDLPDGDGFHLCSMMQAHSTLKDVPVIFLSARDTASDKIMGFAVGADDYLSKPFAPEELKARVDSKLRRRSANTDKALILRVGDLEISLEAQNATCTSDSGERISLNLTPIEFKILLLLARRIDHVHSRNDVLDAVWGENVYVYSRSVDTHVSKLRRKMGDRAGYIVSVHGSGYRLSPEAPKPNHDSAVAPVL